MTSVLQEPKSVEKVVELDEHIGCALSGLIADARTMIDHGRVEAQVIILSIFNGHQHYVTSLSLSPLSLLSLSLSIFLFTHSSTLLLLQN